MKLRVLGTLLGRSDDAQHNSATREEARFRKAEWDNLNYLRHGPRAQAEYHLIDAYVLILGVFTTPIQQKFTKIIKLKYRTVLSVKTVLY